MSVQVREHPVMTLEFIIANQDRLLKRVNQIVDATDKVKEKVAQDKSLDKKTGMDIILLSI